MFDSKNKSNKLMKELLEFGLYLLFVEHVVNKVLNNPTMMY